ncbi:MAG: N-acetylmuramoyl-L-alanine amidase, partial [Gordonibacter sp.]
MAEFIEATYFTSGRGGYDIEKIVPHIAECSTMGGVDATFTNGARDASAHYCVDDDDIHQYVAEGDTAWAVGNWAENCSSISIEHVGTTDAPPSYATLDRSAALMAQIAQERGWESLVLGENVGLHRWYSPTSCPSTIDIDYLIGKANEIMSGTKVADNDVILRPSNGNYAAKWVVRTAADGITTIANYSRGEMLDAVGGQIVDGTNIQTYQDNGGLGQRWRIDQREGWCFIRSAADWNFVVGLELTPTGEYWQDGTSVTLQAGTGNYNQRFVFVP